MEIMKCHFIFFMTVLSILCSKTVAYEADRIRREFESLKDEMSFIRKDIIKLFDKTNQLNISEDGDCGPYVSVNRTSCLPVTNLDGRQDMAKVNDNNVFVKYQSLLKAFVTEKKINREKQDQLQSMEDILSTREKVAKERDQEGQRRLQSIEDTISDIRNNMTLMNQAREEVQSRLQTMEDTVSHIARDLRNRMTLMEKANKKVANETNRQVQSQLRSMEDAISESNKVANERDRQVQDQLRSMEDTISESDKVANERDRQVHSRLRSMRESIEALRNNMISFMSNIGDRIDEHLLKAKLSNIPIINTNCTTVPESGVYTLYLELIMSNVTVYCDQDTVGGGWIVFMRRQDGSVNFDRSWVDYKHGFGSPDGEFWAGNELLHKLTKERPLQLRIDMEDYDGNTAFAMYEEFQVGAEGDKYRLHARGYNGTAGDSLISIISLWRELPGMQFSTFDSDNDVFIDNCAKYYKGGWWYNNCGEAVLTAPYTHDEKREWPKGIIWASWKGWDEALKRVEMKIR